MTTETNGTATGSLGEAFISAIALETAERLAPDLADRVYEKVAEKVEFGPEWMSMQQAAAHIQASYSRFTEAVKRGEIKSRILLGNKRIKRADLEEWADRQPSGKSSL